MLFQRGAADEHQTISCLSASTPARPANRRANRSTRSRNGRDIRRHGASTGIRFCFNPSGTGGDESPEEASPVTPSPREHPGGTEEALGEVQGPQELIKSGGSGSNQEGRHVCGSQGEAQGCCEETMGGDPGREGSESVCCEGVGGPELSVGNNRRRRSVAKPAAEHIGYRVKCDRHALRERRRYDAVLLESLNTDGPYRPVANRHSLVPRAHHPHKIPLSSVVVEWKNRVACSTPPRSSRISTGADADSDVPAATN